MRMLNAVSSTALLAASYLVPAAWAVPNFEVSKTAVSVDRHREALDNGEIIVRVQRTDDLFSDSIDNDHARLLLEKSTHVALRIQVDQLAGTVNVNDEPLDVTSGEGKVKVLKAEAYRLPKDHDAPVVDPDQMLALMHQLSPGIVGVELKLESEPVSPSIGLASFRASSEDVSIEALTIRKVGLWVRLLEVEGEDVSHATQVYTPILQLVVVGSGNKVHKIETLSIDGKSPIDEALAAPGPLLPASLPTLEQVREEVGYEKSQPVKSVFAPDSNSGRPERPHRHGAHQHKGGFIAWLAEKLGMARPLAYAQGRGREAAHRLADKVKAKAGCHGMKKAAEEARERVGKKLETHRPMLENPFSGMIDEVDAEEEEESGKKPETHRPVLDMVNPFWGRFDEYKVGEESDDAAKPFPLPAYVEGQAEIVGDRAHRRPHGPGAHRFAHGHGHGPRRHGRCGRFRGFFRRMAIGFVYGMALMGTLVMHPATLMTVSFVAAAALAFHVTRRIVNKCRGGQVRLGDDEDSKTLYPDEKKALLQEVVVVPDERRGSQDLPVYQEQA